MTGMCGIGTGMMNAGNTLNRFQDKAKNNCGAAIASTAVLAGSGAAIYGANKIKPQTYMKLGKPIADCVKKLLGTKFMTKVLDKVKANGLGAKLANGAKKVVNYLKANPKTALIGTVLAGAALSLNAILNKQSYNDGRIDQKYEDRAAVQFLAVEA